MTIIFCPERYFDTTKHYVHFDQEHYVCTCGCQFSYKDEWHWKVLKNGRMDKVMAYIDPEMHHLTLKDLGIPPVVRNEENLPHI